MDEPMLLTRWTSTALLCLCTSLSVAHAAPEIKGERTSISLAQTRIEAYRGSPEAQYNLAILYYNGDGLVRNRTKAAEWFTKSAKQGLDRAQYNLGALYFSGLGLDRDYKVANTWFRLSAEQNYAPALYALGMSY